jgi:hypothetical protein
MPVPVAASVILGVAVLGGGSSPRAPGRCGWKTNLGAPTTLPLGWLDDAYGWVVGQEEGHGGGVRGISTLP